MKTLSRSRRPAFRPRFDTLEDRTTPSYGWASAVGGDTGNAVATDAAGDVYMTGSFSSSFTPAGSSVPLNSAGGSDIFVTKYSRTGAFQWAVSLGGAGNDSGNGIAVDGTRTKVFVVGENAGGYVLQLDASSGAVNWSQLVSGTAAVKVAVDGSGAAYVTSHQGSLINATVRYVTKLDASGSQQWQDTIQAGSGSYVSGESVAVAGTTVYIGGGFVNSATITIGSNTYPMTTKQGHSAGYVLKLSSDNAYSWAQTYQSTKGGGHVLSHFIASDGSGNVYSYGEFVGAVGFGSKVLKSGNNGSAEYVVKLSPSGSVSWAKQFGAFNVTFNIIAATGIAVDGSGAVYLTGSFSGTVDFNPGSAVNNLTSAGSNDIFVSKLDTNGNYQWAVKAGETGDDRGKGIAVSVFGDVFITGWIDAGTAYFDPTHSLTTPTRTGFLWQIKQP